MSSVSLEFIIEWQNCVMFLQDQRQALQSKAPSAFDLLKKRI